MSLTLFLKGEDEMIELSKKNPPQHFDLTPQELFQKIANLPNLELGWGELLFLKELMQNNIKGQMNLEQKDNKIRVTLYQPNEADIDFLIKHP